MNYNRPRFRRRLTALFTLVFTVGLLALPVTAGASSHNDHTIKLCHATGSESNPYTMQTVPKHQVADPTGHGSSVDGVHPDDVIPPFDAGTQGSNSWDAFAGKNWDTAGQALWNNDCVVPDVEPEPEPEAKCPEGYTKASDDGVTPLLCTRTVIDVQERIVEREVIREVIVEVEVPVPALPEELATGPGPTDDATTDADPVLPTELATGFGPPQNDSNTLSWFLLALTGLVVSGAGIALRRN